MPDFSTVFKNLRKDNKLTQAELGKKLGVAASTVGMYERGQREPDFETLEKIASCLSVNMNTLLGKENAFGENKNSIVGIKIPVLGASDAHRTESEPTNFNKQFSIVLANSFEDIPKSIKSELSVAVRRRTASDFYCVGPFRLVKYVRFLMDEYYPCYEKLCEEHASALEKKDSEALRLSEKKIDEYKAEFFAPMNL